MPDARPDEDLEVSPVVPEWDGIPVDDQAEPDDAEPDEGDDTEADR